VLSVVLVVLVVLVAAGGCWWCWWCWVGDGGRWWRWVVLRAEAADAGRGSRVGCAALRRETERRVKFKGSFC